MKPLQFSEKPDNVAIDCVTDVTGRVAVIGSEASSFDIGPSQPGPVRWHDRIPSNHVELVIAYRLTRHLQPPLDVLPVGPAVNRLRRAAPRPQTSVRSFPFPVDLVARKIPAHGFKNSRLKTLLPSVPDHLEPAWVHGYGITRPRI